MFTGGRMSVGFHIGDLSPLQCPDGFQYVVSSKEGPESAVSIYGPPREEPGGARPGGAQLQELQTIETGIESECVRAFEQSGVRTLFFGSREGNIDVSRCEPAGDGGSGGDDDEGEWRRIFSHAAHKGVQVNAIDVRADTGLVASVCDAGSLALTDVSSGGVVRAYADADPVSLSAVAIAPNQTVLTTGLSPRGQLREWDLRADAGAPCTKLRHPGGGCGYSCLSRHPLNPNYVLCGTTEGEAVWFDLRAARDAGSGDAVLAKMSLHDGEVLALAHHPMQPSIFFSGGADGALRMVESQAGAGDYVCDTLADEASGVKRVVVDTESNVVIAATRGETLLVASGQQKTQAGSSFYANRSQMDITFGEL